MAQASALVPSALLFVTRQNRATATLVVAKASSVTTDAPWIPAFAGMTAVV